jgi:hypothetical protein
VKQQLLLVVLVPVEPLLVELDHHLPIINYEGSSVADPDPNPDPSELPFLDPDPLVRDTDTDPDPSIIKQK